MAASSLPRQRVYDVYLSFRGKDTRRTVVSHLYEALVGRGIVTFRDDRGLENGDPIFEELCRAIQGSRIAVVVLSENYATSKWCLMELQLIMELMMEKRLQVIPIFYGIDPSLVRNQRGSFALEMYQGQEIANKLPRWREALSLIASLLGVVSMDYIDEATMVGEVAKDISRRVTLMHKIDSESFVGVKVLINGLNTLLDLKSNEVLMIGIWGMGGIGKTTIAKGLFDQLSPKFQACCFLENIKDNDHDLMHLQKKLLNSLLHIRDDISLWSVEAGQKQIKSRLRNTKVLLVLDGVDKVAQVHALAKETSWFGPESRIIITTRDGGLLKSSRIKTIYEVKCLDDKDSLQMFKQIAFGGESPPEGFEQSSDEGTLRTEESSSGVSDVSKVSGRSKEEWKMVLSKYEQSSDVETEKSSFGVSDDEDRSLTGNTTTFNFVGMDCHIQAVCGGLMELESDDEIRIVGIWGVGGVGKTTIARLVYEETKRHFHTHVFLENIGKIYQDHGSSRLQEELLWEYIQRTSKNASDVTKARLQNRKVLLIVDGVDNIEQMENVQKVATWFGAGSRVIVTTRDEGLLVDNGVRHAYEVKCLKIHEALQLFYQFAFKQQTPIRFKQLSVRAVQFAGRIPLALEVLASFLRGKTENDWESMLQKLEKQEDKDIVEVAKTPSDEGVSSEEEEDNEESENNGDVNETVGLILSQHQKPPLWFLTTSIMAVVWLFFVGSTYVRIFIFVWTIVSCIIWYLLQL